MLLRLRVLSGPNLDRLGSREPSLYGTTTLAEIHAELEQVLREAGAECVCDQSNLEGELVTWIGQAVDEGFHGLVLNPAAYGHTSVALLDAIKGSGLPCVEVHLTNPQARESFRRRSTIAPACVGQVSGFGARSYVWGALALLGHLRAALPAS